MYDNKGRLMFDKNKHTKYRQPYTHEELATICRLHHEGKGHNQISAMVGRTAASVSHVICRAIKGGKYLDYIRRSDANCARG